MNICICGGGGLGHTTAGVFSSMKGVQVSMLTGHPEKWQKPFRVNDPYGRTFLGKISNASHNPAELIPAADKIGRAHV